MREPPCRLNGIPPTVAGFAESVCGGCPETLVLYLLLTSSERATVWCCSRRFVRLACSPWMRSSLVLGSRPFLRSPPLPSSPVADLALLRAQCVLLSLLDGRPSKTAHFGTLKTRWAGGRDSGRLLPTRTGTTRDRRKPENRREPLNFLILVVVVSEACHIILQDQIKHNEAGNYY